MRTVICANSLPLLGFEQRGAILTSLPDPDEMALSIDEWRWWFTSAIRRCCEALPDGHPAVFYQTDRKAGGAWLSKAGIVLEQAQRLGLAVIWHKIVGASFAPGVYRPSYSHLIAVGHEVRPGKASPDLILRSRSLYERGADVAAARFAADWIANYSELCIDPFCGHGTFLAAAEEAGMEAVGIDIDPVVCEVARSLRLPEREVSKP